MIRGIKKNLANFAAVIGLVVIAALVGGYILDKQRMRFPWEGDTFELKAEFSTAQAVVPGQGQTIRISGVRIGDVAKADLKDGRAIVRFEIDPEYKDVIRTNATALLRPKTGLKDMFVEVIPGRAPAPVAKEGFMIPIANTLPDVNLDEIFASLDVDTRDYLKLLIGGFGEGLKGRGGDLRELLKRFEPTHRDIARVSRAVAERRTNLRRLIRNLNVLNRELASKDDDLARFVSSSADVFQAFAAEQANVRDTVDRLPGALRQTTTTLGKVERFAEVLEPAARELPPAVRALDRANRRLTPFAREATPILRDQIRPFLRDARPLARELRRPAQDLATATPRLRRSFVVLNHLFNMLGYNRDGREGPEDADRDEGYLFWIAWLNHIGASLFATGDANGTFRPVTLGSTCGSLRQTVEDRPEEAFLKGITGALTDPEVCGRADGSTAANPMAKTRKDGK